jgi:uncharacterized protein (DUF2249 family)
MVDATQNHTYVFDARGIAKRFRHSAIFGALEALNHGETMRFVNDHDPIPLLQQIVQRYPGQVRIEYVVRQPEQIVIDFKVTLADSAEPAGHQQSAGGCGSGGGGCGCGG